MTELSAEISEAIDVIADRGNTLMDEEAFDEAIAVFREGIELLPVPKENWEPYLWFLCGVGDAQWFTEDHKGGQDTWRDALLGGGIGNVFVHLRHGQVMFELGREAEAADELLRALLLGGVEILDGEDPKYYDLVTSAAEPPDGCESWDGWEGVAPGTPVHDWLMEGREYELTPKPE